MKLYNDDTLIFQLQEIPQNYSNSSYREEANKFKIKQDGIWSDLDLSKSSILEINFPLLEMIRNVGDSVTKSIPPNLQYATKLLSTCVDHIDILLEDWYPTIGTRFVHTSEGRFLVTRLVPCPVCIERMHTKQTENGSITSMNGSSKLSDSISNNSIDITTFENICLKTTIWNYLWTIEECVLSTYDKKVLVCPIHGDIPVVRIAPDLVG